MAADYSACRLKVKPLARVAHSVCCCCRRSHNIARPVAVRGHRTDGFEISLSGDLDSALRESQTPMWRSREEPASAEWRRNVTKRARLQGKLGVVDTGGSAGGAANSGRSLRTPRGAEGGPYVTQTRNLYCRGVRDDRGAGRTYFRCPGGRAGDAQAGGAGRARRDLVAGPGLDRGGAPMDRGYCRRLRPWCEYRSERPLCFGGGEPLADRGSMTTSPPSPLPSPSHRPGEGRLHPPRAKMMKKGERRGLACERISFVVFS